MAGRFGPVTILFLAACAAAPGAREQGIRLYDASEYEKSILHFSRAIDENPEDAEAYYRRACARLHLLEREAVLSEETVRRIIKDLDRAIEISPDDYRIYYARAMTNAGMARYKEAVSDLLVCIQSQDRALRPKAHRRIAQIYDEKFEDMQEPALRHYEAYLQLGGSDPATLRRVAELKAAHVERGRPRVEDPARLIDLAHRLAMDGKHEESADLLGQLLADRKLPVQTQSEARELFLRQQRALEGERKAETLLETARGMLREGKDDGARFVLDELIQQYPGTRAAQTARDLLAEYFKK